MVQCTSPQSGARRRNFHASLIAALLLAAPMAAAEKEKGSGDRPVIPDANCALLGAFHVLTDRAAIPAEEIERLAGSVPGVMSIHNVRTRGRRDAVYVDLTLHLDGGARLRHAHAVADRIEDALVKAHPGIADVVVHLELEAPDDAR